MLANTNDKLVALCNVMVTKLNSTSMSSICRSSAFLAFVFALFCGSAETENTPRPNDFIGKGQTADHAARASIMGGASEKPKHQERAEINEAAFPLLLKQKGLLVNRLPAIRLGTQIKYPFLLGYEKATGEFRRTNGEAHSDAFISIDDKKKVRLLLDGLAKFQKRQELQHQIDLAVQQGETEISLKTLLPHEVGQCLEKGTCEGPNCFSTAFYFTQTTKDAPSQKMLREFHPDSHNPAAITACLKSKYGEVPKGSSLQAGDLIVLFEHVVGSNGMLWEAREPHRNSPAHAAIYLGNELFFQKSGPGAAAIWGLVTFDELLAPYRELSDFSRKDGGLIVDFDLIDFYRAK